MLEPLPILRHQRIVYPRSRHTALIFKPIIAPCLADQSGMQPIDGRIIQHYAGQRGVSP